jgi:hypothetical protein
LFSLTLVGIIVKICHGRVPHKVEESLHDIGVFLQRYGEANNRLSGGGKVEPAERFHQVRENLIAIADHAERVS